MNLIILVLISQTITASFSTDDSLFDFLGEPSLESDTVSLGSPEQEKGYMKNCYPNSTYSVYWVPKDINPHDPLTFFINYTNPARFDSGECKVDVKYGFIHISTKTEITCQDDMRNLFRLISCPLEKERLSVTNIAVPIKNVVRLKNFTGTFKIKITIENENGESLFCGTFEATVL